MIQYTPTDGHSPIQWIGGKFYSRHRILSAFPYPSSYTCYCEPFAGALHVLLAKPPYGHLEVVNDTNRDLVNFWLVCRAHPTQLQAQIDSLPYARSLYEDWQASLFDGTTTLSDMERAVRFFYVLRSSIGGQIRPQKGNWGYCVDGSSSRPIRKMHTAASLFAIVSHRLREAQIECGDFEDIITRYQRASTLLYCDPPYIGTEDYYTGRPFTESDHRRLASRLNQTPAKVALSYYPDPLVDLLYPTSAWRRVTWKTKKRLERISDGRERQEATELLLLNYAPHEGGLWS